MTKKREYRNVKHYKKYTISAESNQNQIVQRPFIFVPGLNKEDWDNKIKEVKQKERGLLCGKGLIDI